MQRIKENANECQCMQFCVMSVPQPRAHTPTKAADGTIAIGACGVYTTSWAAITLLPY